MKKIFLIGAGRSSAHLIRYLADHAAVEDWQIVVAEKDVESARHRIIDSPSVSLVQLDAADSESRRREISTADLVISMLPAALHSAVAKDCLDAGRPVITPSYVDDAMWALDAEARKKGVLILNEMGVDPGIDHMSAMRMLDHIRGEGGEILHFESYTGGLVAPESDTNPWHYKVTWNPRNVVLAGYGGVAKFRQEGQLKFIPYQHLFRRIAHVTVPGYGVFEGYANRDSLKYSGFYGLDQTGTLLRGTLRGEGFCTAWNALVQLGLTDDSMQLNKPSSLTWRDLTTTFAEGSKTENLESDLAKTHAWSPEVLDKLKWLGIFEERPLNISKGTPAEALQKLIEETWALEPGDRDMIVMWHHVEYKVAGKNYEWNSWMVTEGEDATYTAMSRTVGLPIAIAAKQILKGHWNFSGVMLPLLPEIYHSVLNELANFDVTFHESRREIT